jgi:hypothetical protein
MLAMPTTSLQLVFPSEETAQLHGPVPRYPAFGTVYGLQTRIKHEDHAATASTGSFLLFSVSFLSWHALLGARVILRPLSLAMASVCH